MVKTESEHIYEQYLRKEKLPHIWCPGCGLGIGISAFLRALDGLNIDQNQIATVSGIGCSGRASGYLNFCGLHPTHGRSLAFATGIKHHNPALTVVAFMGDGDGASIGGNHLIHAARRNIDLTALFFNNNNYGMTGGQYSPTTPPGSRTSTSPHGHVEASFDVCSLVEAAGATYVARGTVYHARHLSTLMAEAIRHPGFSFVEIICHCPTFYGRFNQKGSAIQMMNTMKELSVTTKAAKAMGPDELEGKLVIGELVRKVKPEYTREYDRMMAGIGKGEQV